MEDIMKKILALALVVLMLCASLVGCGGNTAYTLASGGTGGTYYAACVGLASVYDAETKLPQTFRRHVRLLNTPQGKELTTATQATPPRKTQGKVL